MDKRKQQLGREMQSVLEGQQQFLKAIGVDTQQRGAGNPLRDPAQKKAIARHIEPLAGALAAHFPQDRATFGVLHRSWAAEFKTATMELFSGVSYEEAAFAILQYTMRAMYVNERKFNYASICRPACDAVLTQYNYAKFCEALPGYAKVVKLHQSKHQDHLTAVFNHLEKKHATIRLEFDDREKVILGGTFLHLVSESTGLFEFVESVDKTNNSGKPTMAFVPTEKFRDWLETQYDRYVYLSPADVPMVCEPNDWTGLYQGGFLTNAERLMNRPILRTKNRELRASGFERSSEQLRTALNRMQKTPWLINGRMLEVLQALNQAESDLGGLPLKPRDMRLEAPPWQTMGIEKDEYMARVKSGELKEEYTNWKHARCREYDRFADEASMRTQFATQLEVSKNLLNEDRFFFCYSMDWRGRVYVQQNCGLDPQGNDVAKALLQFADAKPLGPRGLFWLKVHLANNFGFDKASFEDRAAWADERHADILDAGRNPLDHKWWADADKPFQFLAACMEYAAAMDSGNPEAYESHLPISMDASCSGSQHFSAMLRDPVGGRAVNLVPGQKPSDIYALVAAEAAELMKGNELGEVWLNVEEGWGRKWTKRNTMTYPYSASLYGFADQLIEEVRKSNRKLGRPLFPVPEGATMRQATWEFTLCRYLAKINKEAIGRVVVKMSEAMEWLRSVAGAIAKTGSDIEWTTPIGLRVVQRYRKSTAKRLTLWFGDIRYDPTINSESDKPNTEGHKNGISPNFIHSLDAAHLMRVVLDFTGMGKSIGCVHDSFSTHAANVDLMRDVIRETFIQIYAGSNILSDLHAQLQAIHPDLELPPPPTQGDLDVNVVRDSEYFIS